MIPKTIHYCWFGRNPKPKLAKKCIKSWKKYCPDYEIIEWNEDNFDIASAPLYVRQAYEAKKWAFVTDYVRLKVVYENGGLYFDTDVQVLKSFDEFLGYNSFFGFEGTMYLNTGLGFGAEKGAAILDAILNQYDSIPFFLGNGQFDTLPCPKRNTEAFKSFGLIQNGKTQVLDNDILILSSDYLCPISFDDLKMRNTINTHSIHWFDASWHDAVSKEKEKTRRKKVKKARRKDTIIHLPNKALRKVLGVKKYEEIKEKVKK